MLRWCVIINQKSKLCKYKKNDKKMINYICCFVKTIINNMVSTILV